MGLLDKLKSMGKMGGNYKCDCGSSFATQAELSSHAQKAHGKK